MKADLHCHTHYSDGKHSLQFLAERAIENGVTHLAISDHDCVNALLDFEVPDKLQLISGVEISCAWESREVHIVGLCIDVQEEKLVALLADQQARRRERVRRIDEKLQNLDQAGLLAAMETSSAIAYTRSHVADFLVEQGVCRTRKKVFKTYLNRGGKVYVPPEWCTMEDAIATITGAGGVAVLAHPGRYGYSRTRLRQLVETFGSLGGQAIEVSYPNIAPVMNQYLEQLAEEYSLYLSCGSDFHDAAARWTDVGKFPALSPAASTRAIWQHPVWINEFGNA